MNFYRSHSPIETPVPKLMPGFQIHNQTYASSALDMANRKNTWGSERVSIRGLKFWSLPPITEVYWGIHHEEIQNKRTKHHANRKGGNGAKHSPKFHPNEQHWKRQGSKRVGKKYDRWMGTAWEWAPLSWRSHKGVRQSYSCVYEQRRVYPLGMKPLSNRYAHIFAHPLP